MPWDRKSKKEGIGYAGGTSGDPVLEWHERAPGRVLLDAKVLDTGKPSVIIASRRETNDLLYKCPGSSGFKTHADFEREQICRKCQHRTGDALLFPFLDTGSFVGDLAGFSHEGDYWHISRRAIVPLDCPCASSEWGYDRANARSIGLSTGNALVPKAWKLTWDGNRMRLSFHYRRLYFSPTGKLANDGFFQHIVCDLDSGKTFVTAVSDGSRQAGKKPRAADDITFSGRTDFLSSISPADLDGAIQVMWKHLVGLLGERGYAVAKNETPSLQLIAATNRYPHLGANPFPLRWLLPDRLQRVVSCAPRDAGVEDLVAYLKLPALSDEAVQGCADYPAALGNMMILSDLGCAEEKVLNVAADPDCAVDVEHFFHKVLAGCRAEGVSGIDALEMMLPAAQNESGWMDVLGDMEQMGSEAAHRGSTWINSFAENVASAAMYREFPASGGLRPMVAALTDWKAGVIGNAAEAMYGIDRRLDDSFRCSKKSWKVSALEPAAVMVALSGVNAYMYGSHRYQDFLRGRCAMFVLEETESGSCAVIECERLVSLDRRKYRAKLKDDYRKNAEGPLPEDVVSCAYKMLRVIEPMEYIAKPPSGEWREVFSKAACKWAKKHYVAVGERFSVDRL